MSASSRRTMAALDTHWRRCSPDPSPASSDAAMDAGCTTASCTLRACGPSRKAASDAASTARRSYEHRRPARTVVADSDGYREVVLLTTTPAVCPSTGPSAQLPQVVKRTARATCVSSTRRLQARSLEATSQRHASSLLARGLQTPISFGQSPPITELTSADEHRRLRGRRQGGLPLQRPHPA